jgi:hypothetical protein
MQKPGTSAPHRACADGDAGQHSIPRFQAAARQSAEAFCLHRRNPCDMIHSAINHASRPTPHKKEANTMRITCASVFALIASLAFLPCAVRAHSYRVSTRSSESLGGL